MNWVDIAILAVIGISALISLLRGLIREVLSIVAWVLAFGVAFLFTRPVGNRFESFISVPSVRYIAAFLILLIGTLLIAGLINYLIGRLIDKTGLSGTDRMLGLIFGVLRGVVVLVILVILARATPVTEDPWWQEATLLPHLDRLAQYVISYFPEEIAQYF